MLTSMPDTIREGIMLELVGTMAEVVLEMLHLEALTDMAVRDTSLREEDPSAGASAVRIAMAVMEAAADTVVAEDLEVVEDSVAMVDSAIVVATVAVVAMEAVVDSAASSVGSREEATLNPMDDMEAMAAVEVLAVTEADLEAVVASVTEVVMEARETAAMTTLVEALVLADSVALEEVAATADLLTTRDGEQRLIYLLNCEISARRFDGSF